MMIVLYIKILSIFLYLTKEQVVYFWKKKQKVCGGGGGGGVVIWSGPCYLQRGRELGLFVTQCYCYWNAVCVG